MIFLYVTCKNIDEAKGIAKELLNRKAAACTNIMPISSMYLHDGNITEGTETAMIIKTIDSKVGDVEDIVRESHSYRAPCIASLSLHRLNREYKEWITSQIA